MSATPTASTTAKAAAAKDVFDGLYISQDSARANMVIIVGISAATLATILDFPAGESSCLNHMVLFRQIQ